MAGSGLTGAAPGRAAQPAPPSPLAGIGWAVGAYLLFTTSDALVKVIGPLVPTAQVVATFMAAALLPVLVTVWRAGGLPALRTRHLPWHLTRGLLILIAAFGGVHAFTRMPMADVYAIIFAAPLFVTALSVPFLGEQVGWRRWTATLVGFSGVLVMLRPGAGVMDPAAFAALAVAASSAASMLIVRRIGPSERSATFVFYATTTALILSGAALPFLELQIDWTILLPNIGAGIIGGIALMSIVTAYRQAPAAVIAPFHYSQMLWGTTVGYLFWGELPDLWVAAGAAIVIASGLYILWRETRRPR